LISIDTDKDLSSNLKKWAGATSEDTISNLIKNFKEYENLNYSERIQYCLLPLVSFLNELSIDKKKSLFNSIYFRNTKKSIPEPIKVAVHSNQLQ
jgi:predicted methyltransferase